MESLFHESYPDTMKMSCHPLPMHLKLTLVPTVQQSVSYMKYPYKILSSGRREIAIAVSNWLLSKLNGKKKNNPAVHARFLQSLQIWWIVSPKISISLSNMKYGTATLSLLIFTTSTPSPWMTLQFIQHRYTTLCVGRDLQPSVFSQDSL